MEQWTHSALITYRKWTYTRVDEKEAERHVKEILQQNILNDWKHRVVTQLQERVECTVMQAVYSVSRKHTGLFDCHFLLDKGNVCSLKVFNIVLIAMSYELLIGSCNILTHLLNCIYVKRGNNSQALELAPTVKELNCHSRRSRFDPQSWTQIFEVNVSSSFCYPCQLILC